MIGKEFPLEYKERRKGHDGTITVHRTQETIQKSHASGQIPFVGLADEEGNLIGQIDLPFYCNHYHSNFNNTLLVGDEVGDLVLIDTLREKATIQTLCSHNTSWDTQHTHCHPTFNWNNEKILFTSDREGPCNLYLIELPKQT